MLLSLFSETPDLLTSFLCFTLFTGFLLSRKLSTNSRCCALNSSPIRPLPISQTFTTFTTLLVSSVLLQTLESSECHPSTQNPVVSSLSLNFSYLEPIPCLFPSCLLHHFCQIFLENLSLFTEFFKATAFWYVYVCVFEP